MIDHFVSSHWWESLTPRERAIYATAAILVRQARERFSRESPDEAAAFEAHEARARATPAGANGIGSVSDQRP